MHPTLFQLGEVAAAIPDGRCVAISPKRATRHAELECALVMFVVDFPFLGRLALHRRERRTFPCRDAFVAAWFVTFGLAMLLGVWVANILR
jgi:hypothetical protein